MFKLLLVCFIAAAALVVVYLAAKAAYHVFKVKFDAFMLYRGKRVVVCPETRRYVAVDVDALHAAAAATEGETELRLASCTRWPERGDCDQDCVHQIANAPEDCAVRKMLEDFYRGRSCVLCRKPLAGPRWDEHRPALMRVGDRRTLGCDELPPETLPVVLDSCLPVCWDCHVAESFRREHPELVTDRDSRTRAHV